MRGDLVKVMRDDLHVLTGSYILDALSSDAEREEFERHLQHCPACEAESAACAKPRPGSPWPRPPPRLADGSSRC